MDASRTRLIRLEYAPVAGADQIDRILEFEPLSGLLRVHLLRKPLIAGFSAEISDVIEVVDDDAFRNRVQSGATRIVANPPIAGAYSAPFKLFLDVNMQCQIRCSFCLSDVRDGVENELPIGHIRDIAREAHDLGIFYVKIGGGEPTLYSQFEALLDCLANAGLYITMSSNALGISSAKAELIKKYRVGVSVSISGLEKTSNALMQHKDHFQLALAALRRLRDMGVNVRLRTTLLKENLDEIPALVELAKSNGVKIKFGYCRPAGKAVANRSMLGPADAPAYLRAIAFLNRSDVLPYVILDEGMMFDQGDEIRLKQGNDNACGAARRSLHVNAFGIVSPCVFLGKDYDAGSYRGYGDLVQYWRADEAGAFLNARKIEAPSACSSCSRACKNECPGTRLFHWQDLVRQDPNCLRQAVSNSGFHGSLEAWIQSERLL